MKITLDFINPSSITTTYSTMTCRHDWMSQLSREENASSNQTSCKSSAADAHDWDQQTCTAQCEICVALITHCVCGGGCVDHACCYMFASHSTCGLHVALHLFILPSGKGTLRHVLLEVWIITHCILLLNSLLSASLRYGVRIGALSPRVVRTHLTDIDRGYRRRIR